MFKCWYCTTSLPNAAAFCVRCGKSQRRCAVCGTVNPGEAYFCFQCGTRMRDEAPELLEEEDHDQTRVHFIPQAERAKRPVAPALDPTTVLENQLRALLEPDHVGFLHGPGQLTPRHALLEGENTVGANAKSTIVLQSDTISWTHALIICRDRRVLLQDSASTNGTFVNNAPVSRPVEIHHGDLVSFADQDLSVWLAPHYRRAR